ncbi:MAG: hypothetical protein ABSF53_25910, partial [Terracidiphilus sp.]
EAQPRQLDSILLRILRRSASAALTAVVASVATAFPHASGEALLILLSSPACVLLDRQRLVHESQAPSNLSGLMPQVNASNAVYDEERTEADTRANRRQDLEMAIANLQLGPFAPRVRETLDSLRAQLPAVDQQTEDDRIWRLAMHRMDLRQYTVAEEATNSPTAPDGQTASNDGPKYVRLDLKAPEPDVKDMVDQSAAQFQAMNARLALQMWGLKVYERDESPAHDPGQWRQRLREAHAICTEDNDMGRDGPGIVAAVCVRDHWEEMSNDDRQWCVNIVCSEVERDANQWNRIARLQRHSMSADRPCAWVLPLLLGKPLANSHQMRIRQVLVLALTHAIDEVRSYAAWGIGKHLWVIDRDLALRCVNALAMEATSVQKVVDADAGRPYVDRQQIDELEAKAATLIRQCFFEAEAIADNACQVLEAHRWFGAEANRRILAILGQSPNEPLAIATFGRLTHTLVAWWDADDNRHRHRDELRQERNHETEAALTDLLENFLLRTSGPAATTILQPILDVVDRHTREVHWLIRGLTRVEDRQPNTPQFWSLWELFAERVRRAKWLAGIDAEHASGNEMMTAIFLSSGWKKNVRHWPSLEGHAEHVHSLFNDLPPSATALDDYVRFLYHIGEQSLPEAFVRIATHSRQASGRHALKSNTIYMLEVLLRRHVYTRPLEVKQNAELRDAILQLLELLIDQGSSAAFRMRDDFVTPIAMV